MTTTNLHVGVLLPDWLRRIGEPILRSMAFMAAGLLGWVSTHVMAEPVSDTRSHVIAIDVGHSSTVGGAVSARGRFEYEFNAEMANLLVERLRSSGSWPVVLINGDGQIASLQERVEAAEAAGASIFISVHHDSVQEHYLSYWNLDGTEQHFSDRFEGYSVFYSGTGALPDDSRMLAEEVAGALNRDGFAPTLHHAEAIDGENRPLRNDRTGVYQYDGLYVLRRSLIPAMLLECGVIVNRKEEMRLRDPEYQLRIATAAARGVLDYLGANEPQRAESTMPVAER